MVKSNHQTAVQPVTIEQKSKAIGILGGTFDPIHIGHTESARSVANWLDLSKLLFIPAHIPPHKISQDKIPHASAKQRAAMVELACENEGLFECDQRELQRNGHSYTVDTLTELKQCHPSQKLYFIIGMDSLLTFTTWHKYQDILTLCHLVVNTRPNHCLTEISQVTKTLLAKHQVDNLSALKKKEFGAIIFAKPVSFDISSTQIRKQLQSSPCSSHQQQPFLSSKVIDFINKNQLYR